MKEDLDHLFRELLVRKVSADMIYTRIEALHRAAMAAKQAELNLCACMVREYQELLQEARDNGKN